MIGVARRIVDIVQNNKNCALFLLCQCLQARHQAAGGGDVQIVQRLIQQQILRILRPGHGSIFDYLVQKLDLGKLEVTRPYFALRRYEFFASKTPPEPTLLNSFFLEDRGGRGNWTCRGLMPLL
jgi:hypothetical protein